MVQPDQFTPGAGAAAQFDVDASAIPADVASGNATLALPSSNRARTFWNLFTQKQ